MGRRHLQGENTVRRMADLQFGRECDEKYEKWIFCVSNNHLILVFFMLYRVLQKMMKFFSFMYRIRELCWFNEVQCYCRARDVWCRIRNHIFDDSTGCSKVLWKNFMSWCNGGKVMIGIPSDFCMLDSSKSVEIRNRIELLFGDFNCGKISELNRELGCSLKI